MMMSFACAAMVTIQWILVGYSFAFGPGSSVVGNFAFAGMKDILNLPYLPYSNTVPHTAIVLFQLMFAYVYNICHCSWACRPPLSIRSVGIGFGMLAPDAKLVH
jgi:ammonia channel protein AmtB